MSSFFKSTFFNDREKVIKQSLLAHLRENVKEIQYDQLVADESMRELGVASDQEALNSLCVTLEAIFLHGLKHSFLSRAANALVAADDEKPEPNFWPPLLVISHKNSIEQVQSYTQLHTEIGFCRAWIRQSLNDFAMSSYLKTIRSNRTALDPYYNKFAFIRDTDALEISEKLMSDVEACATVSMPCNAGILNQWPNLPLEMAGLWSPPLRSVPVAQGFDISQTLSQAAPMQIPRPNPQIDCCAVSISNSPFRSRLAEMPPMELDKRPEEVEILPKEPELTPEPAPQSPDLDFSSNLDELRRQFVDSLSCEDDLSSTTESEFHRERRKSVTDSMTNSYSCLFASLQQKQTFHRNTPDIEQIFRRFEANVTTPPETAPGKNDSYSEDDSTGTDFEVLPGPMKFTMEELHEQVSTLCLLANEQGLKNQNFSCKGCGSPLGVGLENAQPCAFDGFYFCNACMAPDVYLIPAKVVYNWDFRKYAVSKKAATFLADYAGLPFIDLKILNPDIYSAIAEMYNLQKLRIQINFVRAYLFNCDTDNCRLTMDKLKRHLFSRAYLYESIHQYSIADLELIKSKAFSELLTKNISIGRRHILECALCSQKGFLCEVCQSADVLYPFDVDSTFRCQKCTNVYHKGCMNETLPCPKCVRIRTRLEAKQEEDF